MQTFKIFVTVIVLISFGVSISEARSVRVRDTFTKTGTYRPVHERTSPNKTTDDNWSTKGNVNPNTGKKGTRIYKPKYGGI